MVCIIRGLISGLFWSPKRWLQSITCGWKPKRNDQKKTVTLDVLTLTCAYGLNYRTKSQHMHKHMKHCLCIIIAHKTKTKFRTWKKACLRHVTDLTTNVTETLSDSWKFQWSILQSLRYSKYRFRVTHKIMPLQNPRILNMKFILWLQIKLHLFAVLYLNPDASSQADTLYHGVTAGRWSSTTYTNHYSNSTDETSDSA